MTTDLTKWRVEFGLGSGVVPENVTAESWHINEDGTLVFTATINGGGGVRPVAAYAAGAWRVVRFAA
jgi:hypothetical protein